MRLYIEFGLVVMDKWLWICTNFACRTKYLNIFRLDFLTWVQTNTVVATAPRACMLTEIGV